MLPSHMEHDGKNEHKRNRGKARLAILSRSNRSRYVTPPNLSSNHASTPRHNKDKSPRRSPHATEIASLRAYFLIYGSAIKTSHKRQRISYLRISNRRFPRYLPFD